MPILTTLKQYINIIIGVFVACITFYLCSLYYNHKIDNINKSFDNYKSTTEKNILNKKLSIEQQNNKLNQDNIDLNNKLKDIENDKYKLYTDLQKANNTIKSSVANGSNRLYINAKCTTATSNTDTKTENNTTSSMDNGSTSKAIIDSTDAAAIIEITNQGDKYKTQLEALQDWVKELINNNNNNM